MERIDANGKIAICVAAFACQLIDSVPDFWWKTDEGDTLLFPFSKSANEDGLQGVVARVRIVSTDI